MIENSFQEQTNLLKNLNSLEGVYFKTESKGNSQAEIPSAHFIMTSSCKRIFKSNEGTMLSSTSKRDIEPTLKPRKNSSIK